MINIKNHRESLLIFFTVFVLIQDLVYSLSIVHLNNVIGKDVNCFDKYKEPQREFPFFLHRFFVLQNRVYSLSIVHLNNVMVKM